MDEMDPLELNNNIESPVDPRALTEIFGDDHAAKKGLLQKFTMQARQIVEVLETAYGQRDAGQIAFQTHKLKSSARTVGANDLADICFSLEIAGRNEDWAEIDSLFVGLRPAAEQVGSYVDDL